MQMGVARLTLPPEFAGGKFRAEQDLDSATVTVTLTSSAKATVEVSMFVSPLAPLIYTSLTSSGGSNGGSIPVTLNTTVLPHFYHRDPNINTTFPVKTTATCGAGGIAGVTRASDFAESDEAVIGAIQHAVVGPAIGRDEADADDEASCSVAGETSASLSFTLGVTTHAIRRRLRFVGYTV